MIPAIGALHAAGVPITVHEFAHRPGERDHGRVAAAALGVEAERVFKTLVVTADDRQVVGIVPVTGQLSLKQVAAAVGAKRAEMCAAEVAERITGYAVGGISPLGQRKRLPTVVDETVHLFDTVLVSGGRRGLDLELRTADPIAMLDAAVADIAA
jgi:Cys-tRNA(Pro)/Cys-tRNA(Cys) deacylase